MLLASDRVFPFIFLPFTFRPAFLLVLIYFFRRKKINPLLELSNPALSKSAVLMAAEVSRCAFRADSPLRTK
jgi:hypothetical protein